MSGGRRHAGPRIFLLLCSRRRKSRRRRFPGLRRRRENLQVLDCSSSSWRSVRFSRSMDGRRRTGVLHGITGPGDICGGIQWGANGPPWPGGGVPGNLSEGSPGGFSFSDFFLSGKKKSDRRRQSAGRQGAALPRVRYSPFPRFPFFPPSALLRRTTVLYCLQPI